MKQTTPIAETIDDYIHSFPTNLQTILQKIRTTVRRAAPTAEETISYRMPAFFQDGALVYFAAFKKHIGFYPPLRDESLRDAIAAYVGPKGNLQFPLDKPIPYALITKIVKARLRENQQRKAMRVARKQRGN